jgi:hypothetical protein
MKRRVSYSVATRSVGSRGWMRSPELLQSLALTRAATRQAAVFRAQAHRQGQPAVDDRASDGGVMPASRARTLGVADAVMASTNVGPPSVSLRRRCGRTSSLRSSGMVGKPGMQAGRQSRIKGYSARTKRPSSQLISGALHGTRGCGAPCTMLAGSSPEGGGFLHRCAASGFGMATVLTATTT